MGAAVPLEVVPRDDAVTLHAVEVAGLAAALDPRRVVALAVVVEGLRVDGVPGPGPVVVGHVAVALGLRGRVVRHGGGRRGPGAPTIARPEARRDDLGVGLESAPWVGPDTGRRIVGSAVSSLFVIVIAVVFWEMVSSVIERYLARSEDGEVELSARAKTLLPLLRKALLVVVSTIVGFIVLSEIGVNIGPLLAGAGVIGLAVGFGSQTLVKDVITGVFILAEDQFAVGDVVRVNGKSGLVEEITIRTIRLRDLGGNVHMIPFSSVEMVENMTKDFSRYVFDVGIAYREDVDEVIDVLRDLGDELQEDEYYGPLINKPIEIMGLDQFADSAVIVRARLTTKPIKQWEVGREFNRRMKRKFDELGIEIPFPHQTIYFGEDKSGDAPPGYIEIRNRRENKKEGAPKRPERPARTDRVDNVEDDGE